jgi:hypothetical protein
MLARSIEKYDKICKRLWLADTDTRTNRGLTKQEVGLNLVEAQNFVVFSNIQN